MLLPTMFNIVSPIRCHWLMISGDIVTTVVYLADVIAMWWCCYHLLELIWLMLLPMLWLMLLPLLYNLVSDHWCTIDMIVAEALLCQWQMLWPLMVWFWLMLLPMADVIARWLMLCHFRYIIGGWCNYHSGCGWKVLYPSGRWNSHRSMFKFKFWCFVQYLIPYMRQMVLAYVLV